MKILKYIFLSVAILFCDSIATAQNSKNDTQKKKQILAKTDTNQINTLNDLAWDIRLNNPDTAIIISNTALLLAENIILGGTKGWKKGSARAYNTLGACYDLKGNYPDALKNYFTALKIREQINDKSGLTKTLGNIGNIYSEQLDFPKALDYYFKALKMAEEIEDKKRTGIWLGNIGIVYMNQFDYPKALDYYFKALKIKEEIGDKNGIAFTTGNIGIVYLQQENYPKALDYYLKALKLAEELGDQNGIARHLGNIGALYTKTGKFKEAEHYLKRSFQLDESLGAISYQRDDQKYLSELYDSLGNYKLSLAHYKKYIVARDSINSEENQKKQVRTEMNYEFEKKEAATRAEQDKKDVIVRAELKQKEQQRNSFIFGFVLVGILALFILRGYKQKQKANIIITQQKREVEKSKQTIEEKNKDITDSINYAKRIQQAMLPHLKDILAAFPQSFVLFKPKDIVSGDFYFFHKKNESFFIATADCTGHGVPGAFMSLIGAGKLNDSVSEGTDTSEILKLLNIGIRTALKQTDGNESTRDGMDIALCSIDPENRILKYAGANRPLWIIPKGQTVVTEIKATKKAIGGLTEDNQHFESTELQLQKGDTFYITTDGYADQFGGLTGKKLMTKKLKEILVDIQNKTMKEQEHYLDNFMEDWKAGTEQVDDILVIGVRL